MKYIEKTVRVVSSDEIDRVVSKEYGREYEFVGEQHASDGWSKLVTKVEAKAFEGYPKEWMEEGKWPGIFHILCDLCAAGVVEPGDYLVTVSW